MRKAFDCPKANNAVLAIECREDVLNFVCVLDIFLMMVRNVCSSIFCAIVTVAFPGRLASVIHTDLGIYTYRGK